MKAAYGGFLFCLAAELAQLFIVNFRAVFTQPMKHIDKIIAGVIIAVMVSVYFATDLSFEMYTSGTSRNYNIGAYLLSLLLASYYGFRYISTPKKASFYFGLLVSSLMLWVCLMSTGEKINLLYTAATTATTTAVLPIDHVEKDMHKGSLQGSKIFVRYNGELIRFSSSRTNYFALKDKQEIRAELGSTADNHYYVSKIYWDAGERGNAKIAYWRYWLDRYWKVPVVIAVIAAFALILEWLRKKGIIRQRPKVWTAKSAGILFLRIIGIIAVLFLLLYLAGLTYMYFRYGKHS